MFIYVLRLVGDTRPESLSALEVEIVEEHFEYLKRSLSRGVVFLAGRCLDDEFGIVIFKADSMEQAGEFVESDPAVKKGVMTAELHPFRIALVKE
jgi:uncharacterized protein YciI